MKRLYYLDTLKVMLTLLVVFHHAAEAYSPYSAWVYHPSREEEMMPLIWHFHSVNAAYFMGLFFLIAGYFVPRSYDRQGSWTFVQKKLVRLGVPVVLVTALLTYVTGQLEVGHLWFVVKSRYANNTVVLITIRDSGDVYEINGAHITLGNHPIDINHAIYRHCEEHNRTFGKPKILVKGIYF
ncbi:MAG: acyltransferase family protein [Bacteroidales bacterium]|nr:acyltransferase family protein [Bacteroidales bacterium]